MKVFLGGTCAETTWRNELKPLLTIDYFDPVVKDWTPECQAEEERQKRICELSLYILTPKMKGVFSVAEVINDSIKNNVGNTVFCVLGKDDDWPKFQYKSLDAVSDRVRRNGGVCLWEYHRGSRAETLQDVANYLNDKG